MNSLLCYGECVWKYGDILSFYYIYDTKFTGRRGCCRVFREYNSFYVELFNNKKCDYSKGYAKVGLGSFQPNGDLSKYTLVKEFYKSFSNKNYMKLLLTDK